MKTNKTPRSHRPKFLAYAATEIAHLRKIGRFGVANNHLTAYRRFSDFLHSEGMDDITFRRITPQLMSDFEDWMKLQGICRNSSSCYLRSLCAIWNRAAREGFTSVYSTSKKHEVYANPFAGTYRGIAKTKKRAIDIYDIKRLRSLDIERLLTDGGNIVVTTKMRQHIDRLQWARDLFIFSFCSRGITFVDMAYLRKTDVKDNVISYSRRKTGQHVEVRIEKPMQDIIDRITPSTPYLFPIVTETVNQRVIYRQYQNGISIYNKSLKELGQMLGGLKLTSYVSRHSWATTARMSNVPVSVISQALGHDSERTTEIYLKSLDNERIDAANRLLIDSVFDDGAEDAE